MLMLHTSVLSRTATSPTCTYIDAALMSDMPRCLTCLMKAIGLVTATCRVLFQYIVYSASVSTQSTQSFQGVCRCIS